MRENVNTVVRTNVITRIIEALKHGAEVLKEELWNPDKEISEEEELTKEQLDVIEKWTKNAEKLNDVEVVSKGNKLKGLQGKVKVVESPNIQAVKFNFDKKQEKEEKEISD